MPRWASRISLEVTGVRVERVQDIGLEDIKAEGVTFPPPYVGMGMDGMPIESEYIDKDPWFWWQELWDSINEKRGYGWDSNPWVWVVEFKREEQ